MKRLNVNIFIDILMMVSFAIVSFSGYLLEDVCRGKVQFMGMMRRQWGDIHLWASIALLVLLILHIVLHWSMIDGFFKKSIKSKPLRYSLYLLLLALALIAIIPWFFIF